MDILIAKIIFTVFIGYFLGSLNGAQILHHVLRFWFPRHITAIGTRNAGTQNVWMHIGRLPAILVLLIDIFKGYFSVWIAFALGINAPFTFLGGIAAIAGHNWPFYFHFRGGRGFATLTGALLGLNFYAAAVSGLLSLIFILVRWSGVTPFSLLALTTIIAYQQWGFSAAILMSFAAVVILIRRLHVFWPSLVKTKRKLWTLKNIIWYDRVEANPPSLRELFWPEVIL